MRAVAWLLALVVVLGGITWWALDSGGVARVGTRTPEGDMRETPVWFVEESGIVWLEAGSPENAWYRDIMGDPRLTLTTEGGTTSWIARPVDDDKRRRALRASLRAKYGWRDWWVGWLVDQDRPVPVRLRKAPR